MNTVVSLLLMMVNSDLSASSQRSIALAVLELIARGESLSKARVAHEAGVTDRAVGKFCTLLGYHNFSELRANIIATLDARRIQMEHHLGKTDLELLERSLTLHADRPFDIALFRQQVDRLNLLIAQAHHVVVLGAVFPQMLSLHYQEDMLMMGKLVYGVPVSRRLSADVVRGEASSDGLTLIISLTGRMFSYYPDEILALMAHGQRMALIGTLPTGFTLPLKAHLAMPFADDDESGNTVLLEMLQYLKCRYHEVHGDGRVAPIR